MDSYSALLQYLTRIRLFDAYRKGVSECPPPPVFTEAQKEAGKRKIFEKLICFKAGQDKEFMQRLNDAAYQVVLDRLYRDMKNGADHLSPDCTPEDLFNNIWKQNK